MKNLLRSAASLVLLSASSAGAIEIVGLTTTGDLVRFQRNTPGTITTVPVTNLPDGMML